MNQCPPEIWETIFAHACTDNGFTGRSLSLVSVYFYEMSKPWKYQSISATNLNQIISLATILVRLSPQLKRVRHLFLASPGESDCLGPQGDDAEDRNYYPTEGDEDGNDDSDNDDDDNEKEEITPEEEAELLADIDYFRTHEGKVNSGATTDSMEYVPFTFLGKIWEVELLQALYQIFDNVAPFLWTLSLHLGVSFWHSKIPLIPSFIPFPSLLELSTTAPNYAVWDTEHRSLNRLIFHSLERLSIREPFPLSSHYWCRLNDIAKFAPSLTHLRIPLISTFNFEADKAQPMSSDQVIRVLPSTMKRVIIDHTPSSNMIHHLEKHEAVKVVAWRNIGITDAQKNWECRINGKEGPWSVRNDPMYLSQSSRS